MKKVNLSVLVFASLMLSGFALAVSKGSMHVGPSCTLTFVDGKSELTEDSRKELKDLIQGARVNGKIEEVQIAAWSDNPIPLDKKELSQADGDLAGRRLQSVQDYLEKKPMKISSFKKHNMAERSSWLSQAFETSDAVLKEEIIRGDNVPMSKNEFRVFRKEGKPSKVVVLTIIKNI